MPHVRLTWTNDFYIVNVGKRFNINIKENLLPHGNLRVPE